MALILGFGLLFATAVVLITIPGFNLIVGVLRAWSCVRFRVLFPKPEV